MDADIVKNIRRSWLKSIFEFAHQEFQHRLWVQADYPDIIGNYTEAICTYFDDLNLDEGYKDFIKDGIIDQVDYSIIAEFHNELEKYTDKPDKKNLSDKHVLLDPEWRILTSIAKSTWDKLKIVISDKGEIEFMKELENNYLKNDNR
jgi:hypothetical protein